MIVTTNCKFMAIYTFYFVHKMSICEKSLYIHLMIFNDMISYLFQWLKMINKTGVSKSFVCGLVVWVWSDICYPGDWVNQDYDIFIVISFHLSSIVQSEMGTGILDLRTIHLLCRSRIGMNCNTVAPDVKIQELQCSLKSVADLSPGGPNNFCTF